MKKTKMEQKIEEKEISEKELKEKDEHQTEEELKAEIKGAGKLDDTSREEFKTIIQNRLGEIEEGESAFNIEEYVGIRTVIERITFDSGEYGDMIKAETSVLGVYTNDEGEQEIRASILFSIYHDGDIIKYRPKSKLAKFLAKHKLKSPAELMGCKVLTSVRSTDKGDFVAFV